MIVVPLHIVVIRGSTIHCKMYPSNLAFYILTNYVVSCWRNLQKKDHSIGLVFADLFGS